MKLLLINNNVEDYSSFVNATNNETEVIVVNPVIDSYTSILEKKLSENYDSVGIVDYNYNNEYYSLVYSEENIFTEEGMNSFITFLKHLNTPTVDFMACSLFNEQKWRDIFDKIETYGINCRSSNDLTGNLSQGGDWILESEDTPVNVASIYFTSLIENYSKLLDNTSYITFFGDKNPVVETDDYKIYNYGYLDNNGNQIISFVFFYKKFKKIWITGYGSSSIATYGYWLTDSENNILDDINIIATSARFICFKSGEYVYIFSPSVYPYAILIKDGINGSPVLNVSNIINNGRAFALVNNNGVYAIGDSGDGGINPFFATRVRLENGATGPFLTDVQEVYSSIFAFAVKGASGVYAWGNVTNGGINTSFATQVRLQNGTTGPFLTDVQEVYSNANAFVVKGVSGVYAWGNVSNGGINSGFATQVRIDNSSVGPLLISAEEISTSFSAFAVKTFNDDVYAWGLNAGGGINSGFATQVRIDNGSTGSFLKSVNPIVATENAFLVRGDTGSYIWGNLGVGGWSTTFAQLIGDTGAPLTNIISASQARFNSFFAKTDTENYIIESSRIPRGLTGYTETVGGINQAIIFNNTNLINTFGNIIDGMAKTKNADDIDQIVLNRGATIFGNSNGVFARGLRNWGGFAYYNLAASKVRVDNQFTGSFLPPGKIYSTVFYLGVNNTNASIVVKGASGIYAWGNAAVGGINTNFATQVNLQDGITISPLTDVEEVYPNAYAFAVKGSSGVYAWGDGVNGGLLSANIATQLRLQNGTTGPFLTDVEEIYSTAYAFAVKGNSGVYAWGNASNGGIATNFATQLRLQDGTTGPFLTDMGNIYSTNAAFAVKGNSGVYAWGNNANGGINTSFATQVRLENGTTGPFLTDVEEVYSNQYSFAVKGSSGVYVWGNGVNGGINTSFATQIRINDSTSGSFLTGVDTIYGMDTYFIAKKSNEYYAWGSSNIGSTTGLNANYAIQVPIADFDEIIKPAQIENTDIELNSTKTTVGQIISQAGVNVEGIAITKATNWRYKPSSSSTWKTIEDVDVDNSLLLLQDTELEYITDAKAEPTLEFKAWNGEIGDEEDYLNTNIEYFNLVSDNTASVTVKTEPPTPTPSDNSTLRIIIIAIIVAVAIIVLYFVIYYIWKYFNTKPSKLNPGLNYRLL